MTYLARELITRSMYLSKVVARDAQNVTGAQEETGLFLLNSLLSWKVYNTPLIPYYTYDTSVTAVTNQEEYPLENVYDVESVTFNIGDVRYSMVPTSRKRYFGSSRVDNVASLPFNWYFLPTETGGTLYMYFLPAGEYPLRIMCKKALTNVTLDTDLSTVYNAAYIEYLRYSLAQYICADYGIELNAEANQNLKAIVNELMYVTPYDLTMQKVSILSPNGSYNMGDVNLGRGYRP